MSEKQPKNRGRGSKTQAGTVLKTTAVRLSGEMLIDIKSRAKKLQEEVPTGIVISTSDVVRTLVEAALKGEVIELEPNIRSQVVEFQRELQESIRTDLQITITFGQAVGLLVKKGLEAENRDSKKK